ncbi:nitroreductase family protein [Carboxylicivirga sp. A043]|uniref:nitroreductase family protein n=1 Tax=Carboxylicivirga litoralis TaxID=2816963 RepID=UPI0021CB254B|nr:nitroreductase family protein [Carboxylicivirga sp. A043]MCU4156794.1 nitroreductase family protein [Carboxylicivirga sp. A043]
MQRKIHEIYGSLGANERAIVDSISIGFIRSIVIRFIDFKLKLQWTGWLQYLILVPINLLILLLALTFQLLGLQYIAYAVYAVGSLFFLRIVFDVIAVKYKVRLPEKRPKRKENFNVFDTMIGRSSCRSFQTKKLANADLKELINSVNKHLKEPKFSKSKVRIEYISAQIRVWPVVNAREFFVAITPKEYDRLAILDVGKTLQKVVIDATRMGLGTCWIGPGADHNSIISVLGNQFNADTENIICICAIGYKSKYNPLFISLFSKKMRSRMPIESLFFDSYEMTKPISPGREPYNLFGKTYESCRWAPSSYNGQTTRGIITLKNGKFKRIDFIASTTSKYYAAIASGIWCANWELGCNALNIKGNFKKLELETTDLKENCVYDISWEVV